ncbi:MAG TPA: CbtA family protein [Acidimicrobiia bacterium]|nr:CbtA family protein [Acidimicrobiia bacterium]
MWKRFDPSRPLAVVIGAVVAGLLAGLVASVLLTFTAEPVIDRAIALEESRHAAASDGDHGGAQAEGGVTELVSRPQQKGVGRFAAYSLGGAAYGVLFGIAFLALRRRPGEAEGAFRHALLAAGFTATAFTVMPFLKYPPNPPAVGDPATISERQWKYLALIFMSVVILAAGARLSTRLRERQWVDHERLIAVGLAVVVPLGVLGAALPPYSDSVDFPADLLWRFRIATLGGNLLLWTVLAVTFGAAAVRRERELAAPAAEPTPAAGPALRPAATP